MKLNKEFILKNLMGIICVLIVLALLLPFMSVKAEVSVGGFGGGSSRGRSQNAPQRGSDLQYNLTLTFEEAAFGCRKEFKFQRSAVCDACAGTGAKPGTQPQTCPTCHGSGQQRVTMNSPFGQVQTMRTCPTCGGKGKIIKDKCSKCSGTGFTRVTADENQQPVFIKTLGNSVTLWFDLEQDIDALNGNAQLSLAADANGYDQQFGIPKTNFGRGTLIVRHTDYQNAKNEPAVYTDYLLAKGTTGANTRIVLHEEGDYEVALDYEVQDGELTHITSKFGNYRIFLRFSIRNGNCMVYPFDLLTGAELQNTSVAEAGFSLDLARSRYLDINVRRAVLVETANGVIEDERFNRPAKDGDRYTQEGIYTISVSNRYTGESTTKTIFVGSQELLETYVRNGFSLERLK